MAISLRTCCPFYKPAGNEIRIPKPYEQQLQLSLHVELAKATVPDLGLPERRTATDRRGIGSILNLNRLIVGV